ncbi:serine hydrolase [Lysobacter sp. K5869]|uniref:serine hydrolase n=1 Tax=Lysobacter sp. K5869 TaxID=2820808 RepID=UPI001C06354E|nr:serine hydrolase [Lysobacter sp. K5869]QWP75785.1 serine hydrolase [Lysobacter sp. K5869]
MCSATQAQPADTAADQTDRAMRAYIARFRVPGAQVAVVKDGAIVFSRAYGSANVALDVPATVQSVFTLASISKAFTGVAAMQAVEAGKFDLAAPIATYLDGLPEAWRVVTVRQLLSHTSGLPDINRAPTVETDAVQAWNWALAQPVLFAPGERFHYCQTNYTLIQRALNRVYGREEDATVADAQLAAAGMGHSRYGDSRDVIAGKGPDYQFVRSAPGAAGVLEQRYPVSLPFKRASNGLVGNAEDVARWLIALQQGTLLGPEAVATMWTPVAFNDGRAGQWGLGWTMFPRGAGHRAVGMTGGARSAFYLYPQDNVAVVILTNLSGAYPEDEIDRIAGYWAPALRPTGVPALRIALDDGGYGRAVRTAREIARRDPSQPWNEAELNDWGYRLLHSGRPREGLAIMKLVAALFPRSGNAQDSLGEAHALNGENALAIAHYRRALALDPGNKGAARQIERLQKASPGGR